MLGAKVIACEEVRKYSRVTDFLINAYEMKNIRTAPHSLYNLPDEYINKFDIVHYAGVLYHVSDPLLSLRLLYNVLKPGGIILIETNACCNNLCKFILHLKSNIFISQISRARKSCSLYYIRRE
jgi:2-polyprenyl-3-methyl-5-hydroxy-6-metoxy-1,4-benzoquinol methylase